MSVGLDCGTGNIVCARQDNNGEIKLQSIKNAFLELPNDSQTTSMLKLTKANYIEDKDKIYIIGAPAVTLANIFSKEVRRPMSKGVISAGEIDAMRIMSSLVSSIMGPCKTETPEVCFYSIPANPIDAEMDIVYHSAMWSKILTDLGYKPVSMLEPAAAVFSSCALEEFSALCFDAGAGMINIALLFQTIIGLSFSLTRSGDFIDQSAARTVGTTASKIQQTKESGIDLLNVESGDPKTLRERESLIVYFKSVILYALENIKNEFKRRNTVTLPHSIPLILTGGSTLPKNFLEFFKAAFNTIKDQFPIPISEIKLVDPLNSVAKGLLVAALNYSESQH